MTLWLSNCHVVPTQAYHKVPNGQTTNVLPMLQNYTYTSKFII